MVKVVSFRLNEEARSSVLDFQHSARLQVKSLRSRFSGVREGLAIALRLEQRVSWCTCSPHDESKSRKYVEIYG